MKHPFQRTKCACHGCRQCCETIPGNLVPGDFEAIRDALGVTDDQMEKLLLASPGALVRGIGMRGTFRIGTIVPKRNDDGHCIFYTAEGHCLIHEVAPFGCQYFDVHMSGAKGDKRSKYGLNLILRDPLYQQRHRRLKAAGRVAPAPETLRKEMAR